MKIFVDIFTNEEIGSDSYPISREIPGIIDVTSDTIIIGAEQVNTGSNPAEGETEEAPEGERVNNGLSPLHAPISPFG